MDKTPRQQLREQLEENRREIERWPTWMKASLPTFESRSEEKKDPIKPEPIG